MAEGQNFTTDSQEDLKNFGGESAALAIEDEIQSFAVPALGHGLEQEVMRSNSGTFVTAIQRHQVSEDAAHIRLILYALAE